MSQKKEISILDCNDFKKYDMNISLYIYELEIKTIKNKINWIRKWNFETRCFSYCATYTNSFGVKVQLDLLDNEDLGTSLYCAYYNHKKLIKSLYASDYNYSENLNDLLVAVQDYIKLKYNKEYLTNPYYNTNKYLVPYHNDNSSNYVETKVKNQRGKKADKLLENVQFETNFQILGEIAYF